MIAALTAERSIKQVGIKSSALSGQILRTPGLSIQLTQLS